MEPVITPQKTAKLCLLAEPWFLELMTERGFKKTSENAFTRGKSQIRVDGAILSARQSQGDTTYKADFSNANQESVTFMVDQMLKLPAFLSDEELDQQRAEKQRVIRALNGIAETIKEGPDTGGGVQLRQFLWSIYNMHHVVNLWRLAAELDSERGAWVAEVFAGTLSGLVKDKDIKQALQASGEMDRWDREQAGNQTLASLQDAANIVNDLAKKALPSRPHTVLVSLLGHISEAKRDLLD